MAKRTTLREDMLNGGVNGNQYKTNTGMIYTILDFSYIGKNDVKIMGTSGLGAVDFSLRSHLSDKRYIGRKNATHEAINKITRQATKEVREERRANPKKLEGKVIGQPK